MPSVPKGRAIDLLSETIERLPPDDLAEVHNELFPQSPVSAEVASERPAQFAQQLIRQLRQGPEAELIVDLWNVVFPQHRGVFYDEEAGTIQYEGPSGSVQCAG